MNSVPEEWDFHTRIDEVRKWKGIRQDELARYVGVRRETISRIEHGTSGSISVVLAMKIARALGTTVEELFFFGSEENDGK